ncbi:hypothetical protein M2226_003643 [Bradyrhizobium elkanii]|uniref:integrase n=1 Tax=Bradyrhizobium elkanii TaxID=29448 RepID=UPI002225E118|nr:integrase [Bradyrhizobium elkanii]MCW2124899.1 hypothetical protein [Bradyrhizobium elkanii]MCW2171645.1 hypothetical protein [Bradyrhizobium elkanii]
MNLSAYSRYLESLESVPFSGRFMPYGWHQLPNALGIEWMAYGQMIDEFSREIANSINNLTNYTHNLKAWDKVLSDMMDDDQFDALHGAIDPLAVTSINLPHVIRSRVIFATTHLCHQANQSIAGASWVDDLKLDEEIYMQDAINRGKPWKTFKRLNSALERLYDRKYQTSTHDFRNSYNHRFSPKIGMGLTQIVSRSINPSTKQVIYAFRLLTPIRLDFLAELLTAQCERAYAVFGAFQDLVNEHTAAIKKA